MSFAASRLAAIRLGLWSNGGLPSFDTGRLRPEYKPHKTRLAADAAGPRSQREDRPLQKPGRTLLAKIWDQHVIARISDDTDLLHVDRHLLHDLGGSRGLLDLKSRNLSVHNPELTFATPDHAISTARGRAGTIKIGQELLAALRVETSAVGIEMFDIDEPGQGIVHVIGPELGLSLPGCLIVCGDSQSTVLNMIATLIKPSSGQILIDGTPVIAGKAMPNVGYVF
jgi:Aconitase family (aconitate hydratase)